MKTRLANAIKCAIMPIATLTLIGCAMNPNTLQDKGIRNQFTMRLPPSSAAACVARNAESRGDIQTSIREGVEPSHVALLVGHNEYFYVTADFAPSGNGSAATAFFSPDMITSSRQFHIDAFKGC